LFIWALRHPASSYVQGINDLVGPFFDVFIKEAIAKYPSTAPSAPSSPTELPAAVPLASNVSQQVYTPDRTSGDIARKRKPIENADLDVSMLNQSDFFNVEADSYWCVTKFIDSIQVSEMHLTPKTPLFMKC